MIKEQVNAVAAGWAIRVGFVLITFLPVGSFCNCYVNVLLQHPAPASRTTISYQLFTIVGQRPKAASYYPIYMLFAPFRVDLGKSKGWQWV